ncbi:MAG TPA: N-acetylglucosamine-6-phosphate deacetylase [Saprospiraceae bacterium]|nr:N-acetylglucosamine-6-phosphate deacetylase [Saprospiraceae bacterium]HPN70631.1 N-acetylglucosamine-6-phosphate deacetylase [Saprospiraceae bacterium]
MPFITARKVFTNDGVLHNQAIHFDSGKISRLENWNGDFEFENIAPALFDTHINGGANFYFTSKPDFETLRDMSAASHQTGTYYLLPALITSSIENILHALSTTADFITQNPNSGILGIHLEGPYLHPSKRGAHLEKYIRKPDDAEIAQILEVGKEVIKIWTIAPELFTDRQLKTIMESGITLSVGHSNASYEQANHAFDMGISLATHLYNAMSAFHHRNPGLVGAALLHPRVWAPIILDGKHCHFGAAQLAYMTKPDRLFLISDALFLGRKKQSFQWEEFDAELINDEYINSEGNLAGSSISLPEAIVNAVNYLNIPLEIAIEMASLRPARAMGLDQNMGKIALNYPANFLAFDDDLTNFRSIS